VRFREEWQDHETTICTNAVGEEEQGIAALMW
jgi:hypothetical protein